MQNELLGTQARRTRSSLFDFFSNFSKDSFMYLREKVQVSEQARGVEKQRESKNLKLTSLEGRA